MTLWPIFAEEARARKLAGTLWTQGPKGRTRDFVAQFLGISGRTMERLKYIYDHEDEYPDQVMLQIDGVRGRHRGRTLV